MKRLALITVTTIILISVMGLSITIANPTQITNDPEAQGFPAISGNNILWLEDSPNGPNDPPDIYLYDIETGIETKIVSYPPAVLQPFQTGWGPAISGDKIVWDDLRNGNWDIYLYDIAADIETQITTDPNSQGYSAISGDKIVWVDFSNGNQVIYLYDIITGITTQVPNSTFAAEPAISGDKIVWNELGGLIYLHDITTGITKRIANELALGRFPKISGNNIVWGDSRNGSAFPADIYLYDIETGIETRITTDLNKGIWPAISGDNIVWIGFSPSGFTVYFYDIATGTTIPIINAPLVLTIPLAISGDKIVWTGGRNGNSDIYLYELETTTTTSIITTISTTTSTPSSPPCPASLIYGTDSAQTQLLRSIRDNILSQSHEGRELIKLYYQWSPLIVRAMEADEDFKEDIREMIDGVLGVVE